ncbi:MAG: hypothetical protein ABJP02_16675 [Parasphingorhabdus sp.]|uniref:hypothetical protein n=1 Tax=Parasphingorhabdus sp. TaxID=2709688 RepID=UPI003296C730
MKHSVLIATALLGSAVTSPVMAQQDLDEQKSQLEKEKALIEAQTALITAKTAKTRAKFGFDDLPSFENKTTLGTSGGEIEAALLISTAVEEAASTIVGKITNKACEDKDKAKVAELTDKKMPISHRTTEDECGNSGDPDFLIITGSNKENFNLPVVLQTELESLESRFRSIPRIKVPAALADGGGALGGVAPAAIVPFVTALSGLLGTETTVTGVEVGVDDEQLAVALAGQLSALKKSVRLYHHDPGRLRFKDLEESVIGKQVVALKEFRDNAMVVRKNNSPKKNQTSDQNKTVEKIDVIVASFDALYGQITKRGGDGLSIFVKAILLNSYNTQETKIVRVKATKSGGSLIHSKNIWTTFGVDPLKVSGGLLVSYSMVDSNGNVEVAGRLACRTSLASLRKIQSGKWKNTLNSRKMGAECK